MTIVQFRDLLFGVDTDLANGLTLVFVKDTMIEDFNRIIACLQVYNGENRRGVSKAGELMDAALRNLYTVYASLLDKEKKNTVENINIRVDAFVLCRIKLRNAYEQLEHLARYLPKSPNANK